MISAELLGTLIDADVLSVRESPVELGELMYSIAIEDGFADGYINIDTVTRLGKEWAITNNCHLQTQSFTNPNYQPKTSDEAVRVIHGEVLSTLYQCTVKDITGWVKWVCSGKTENEVVCKAVQRINNGL